MAGALAGGIAHEFNNLLNVVIRHAELLGRRLPDGDPLRRHTSGILLASERATALTRQLMTFGRRQASSSQASELGELLLASEPMLRNLVGPQVRVLIRLPGEPVWIKADPAQIGEALVHLASNARDAMPDGGSLEIDVSCEAPPAAGTAQSQGPPGAFARLAVTDSGTGMNADTLPTQLRAGSGAAAE